MNEYILLFRKLPSDTSRSYADIPVTRPKADSATCPLCNQISPFDAFAEIEHVNSTPEYTCPKCKASFGKGEHFDRFLESFVGGYPRREWQIQASGYWRSSGDRLLKPTEMTGKDTQSILRWYRDWNVHNVYDYRQHVELGSELEKAGRMPSSFMLFAPGSHCDNVWTDIVRMRTLKSNQSQKRAENHVCPLQLDLVERLIDRYSIKGELVYDPFGGLMTVPFQAIKMDRRGYGVELNAAYWRFGVEYCKEAEYKKTVPTLFDFLESQTTVLQ